MAIAKHKVYRNLNKPGCIYSIQYKGRVIGYQENVILINATFKHPTQKALNRIRPGHREVCSWVSGTLIEKMPHYKQLLDTGKVESDPKKFDTFTIAGTTQTIDRADIVYLNKEGCFYVNHE